MLEVKDLHIKFDEFALQKLSFKVEPGEYFMLLGESGAGKSVLLECIAGIIKQSKGNITLNNVDISDKAIQKRNVGLVFQDFALFPNYSVKENIAYPLKIAKKSKDYIDKKISELTSLMEIEHLINRDTTSLSGGEKQRVALARTLTLEPNVLLLDEPLSAIDVSLKGELRSLLRKLNNQGQTIVHVTHDYEEAISLAHRIAIMHCGTILQMGSPHEVFHNPKNKFVANFGGIKNFFPAEIVFFNKNEASTARISNTTNIKLLTKHQSNKGHLLISQKNISISRECNNNESRNNFKGKIKEIIPARFGYELVFESDITYYIAITNEEQADQNYIVNEPACISFSVSSVRFIPG